MSQNGSSSQVMVEAKGLSKFYGEFIAVENVSFQVRQGTITAFLGPNGAGKSTVMKMITGYMAPSEGEASIGGKSVQRDRLGIASLIGYLPENGPLYNDMTPKQYLTFMGSARGLQGDQLNQRMSTVSEQCELGTVWNKRIGKLSKGFRQRVGLANALLHDPEVLILDEPTSGLDPNQIQGVRNLLSETAKQKTVLISTHILQEVSAVATDVIMINEGRLVFTGAPSDLGDSPQAIANKFHELTGHESLVGGAK